MSGCKLCVYIERVETGLKATDNGWGWGVKDKVAFSCYSGVDYNKQVLWLCWKHRDKTLGFSELDFNI